VDFSSGAGSSTIPPLPGRKDHLHRLERFESLEEIEDYVDDMIASRWWESRFPHVRAVEVRMGRGEDPARGGIDSAQEETATPWESWGSGHIELPPGPGRS
jgi:hypothetical protein